MCLARPELLAKNPTRFVYSQWTIVINFHQEFVAIVHIDFLHKQADRGLIY